jgi:hypothetical protein
MRLPGDGTYEIPKFQLLPEGWYLLSIRSGIKWGEITEWGGQSLSIPTMVADGELDGASGPTLFVRKGPGGEELMANLLQATGLGKKFEAEFPDTMKCLDEAVTDLAAMLLVDRLFKAYIEVNTDRKGQDRNMYGIIAPPDSDLPVPEKRQAILLARQAETGSSTGPDKGNSGTKQPSASILPPQKTAPRQATLPSDDEF